MPSTTGTPSARSGVLETLRVGGFRRLWFSSLCFGFAQQMELLVVGWWMLEVTNNPFLVGLIGSFRFWPSLIGPFGGAFADRFDRKVVLIVVECFVAGGGLVLLTLVLLGRIQVWHTFAVTLAAGIARVIDNTTRQTVIGDVLPPARVGNGTALIYLASSGTAILAPPIGGVLYKSFGLGSGYVMIAFIYCLAIVFTLGLPPIPMSATKAGKSIWRGVVEGLDFVRRDDLTLALMWIAAIANLCGYPLVYALLPIFARDLLGTDSVGLGLLTGAIGIGSIAGSLFLASARGIWHRGRLLFAMMILWMAVLIVFAFSRSFALSLGLLVLVGVASGLSMSTVAAMLMDGSPIAFRGRVMGVRQLAILTLPIATTLMGAVIGTWGPTVTLLSSAVLGIVLTGITLNRLPRLWYRP